jgi:exodeoxyribonuclease V alpha subunit
VTTRAGQRIGTGDRIATRRNDRTLGVANRDTWTVTSVGPRGDLTITPAGPIPRDVTPSGVTSGGSGERVLPAGYVTAHVELAYASTAHGVQGDTVAVAHVVLGKRAGAGGAYVGMTRGRTANTAHLVARDRADLGPAHAAELAAAEAARYATPRPLEQVLAELHTAWTAEQGCRDRLDMLRLRREVLHSLAAADAENADQLIALENRQRQTASAAQQATERAAAGGATVAAAADRLRDRLLARWDAQRKDARQAARIVLNGPGRLGLRRGAVHRAEEQLAD